MEYGQSKTVPRITKGGDLVRVVSLSYVGQIGFEIHASGDKCQSLLEDILEAGREDGIMLAGMEVKL